MWVLVPLDRFLDVRLRRALACLGVIGILFVSGFGANPVGATLPDPLEVRPDGGAYSFSGSTYSIDVHWPSVVDSLGAPLFEALVVHGGREGTFVQGLEWTSWFTDDAVEALRFQVSATSGQQANLPWLRLDFSVLPTDVAPQEVSGSVAFWFAEDMFNHRSAFQLPGAGVAPLQLARTTVEWTSPSSSFGSIDPSGAILKGDDGSALDPYGGWQEHHRYAVYQEHAAGTFGHARVEQGDRLNYLEDGRFRVDENGTVVESVFNGFIGIPTVLGDRLWAIDAFLFGDAAAAPSDLAQWLGRLVLPTAPGISPVTDPTAHPVVIGIPDTGINPYHELYYREDLTAHPSTYIDGYPADVPALELSVGGSDWDTMFDADLAIWEGVEEDTWYWIPQTLFVAVYCSSGQSSEHRGRYCILDDGDTHGTGTTSSALMENPNALLAFAAGPSAIAPFAAGGIPVDVYSVSWGNVVPVGHPDVACLNHDVAPIYVISAGNDARSTLIDCRKGDARVISVGGAYAEATTEEITAGKHADVVSYFCRPVTATRSVTDIEPSACGTSFAAPTVAGALSKVIQAVRTESGYRGGVVGEYVDPIAGLTIADLRAAMNRTASYAPEARYQNQEATGIPVNDQAPWLQWSWGFYDGLVANATIEHLLGEPVPEKPPGAVWYMEHLGLVKGTLYGPLPFDVPDDPGTWPWQQDDAGSGGDAPDRLVPDVWVEPGVVYEGTFDGTERYDHYALWGTAGDEMRVAARASFNNVTVLDGDGRFMASGVADASDALFGPELFVVSLQSTGIHYLRVTGYNPGQYAFGFGINEEAPEPGLAGLPVPPVPPVV